jgi:DNA-binding transcriptional MerR regulator
MVDDLAASEPLSIGDVINLLRDDFPDVSVSKIRFLEAQGLVTPGRSPSGYRQFGPAEINRLRYILGLQRDHFLPLKVIKSKLTLWERGEDGAAAGAEPPAVSPEGEPLSRPDLLRRSGLSDSQLEQLEAHGLLIAIDDSDGKLFPAWALAAAIEARQLLAMGFEPRHLRRVRLAAAGEAEMLRQLLLPRLVSNQPEVRARARQGVEEGAEAVGSLHRVLLAAELRNLVGE